MLEWYEIEDAIEKEEIKVGIDVIRKKIEFVAGLFDDKRVTYDAIINGLDAREFNDSIQMLIFSAMGHDTSDDKDEGGKD